MEKILKAESKVLFNRSSAIVVDEKWCDMYVMNVVQKMEDNEYVDVAIVFEMYWNEYDINDVDEEGENVDYYYDEPYHVMFVIEIYDDEITSMDPIIENIIKVMA